MQFNKNVPSVGLPRLPCLARIIGHAVSIYAAVFSKDTIRFLFSSNQEGPWHHERPNQDTINHEELVLSLCVCIFPRFSKGS